MWKKSEFTIMKKPYFGQNLSLCCVRQHSSSGTPIDWCITYIKMPQPDIVPILAYYIKRHFCRNWVKHRNETLVPSCILYWSAMLKIKVRHGLLTQSFCETGNFYFGINAYIQKYCQNNSSSPICIHFCVEQ